MSARDIEGRRVGQKGSARRSKVIFKIIKQKKMKNEHRKNYSVDTVVSPVPWVK